MVVLKLLLTLAFAFLCEIVKILAINGTEHFGLSREAAASPQPLAEWIGYVTGISVVLFLIAGTIPMVIWALVRFRRTATNGVILLWAALILGGTFLQFIGASTNARGAELKCFISSSEARGFYFIKFAVEQAAIAKKCDDTYALWNPLSTAEQK